MSLIEESIQHINERPLKNEEKISILSSAEHNLDEDDEFEEGKIILLQGYRPVQWRALFYYFICLLSGGIVGLLGIWFSKWALFFQSEKCSLDKAKKVYIQRKDKSYDIIPTETIYNPESKEVLISIQYRCQRYLLETSGGFFKPKYDTNYSYSYIRENLANAKLSQHTTFNQIIYGPNLISVPVRSHLYLLLHEVLHPFYFFQVFSIIVWGLDEYYIYASAIFITSAFAAMINVIQLRSNMMKLQAMATFICDVQRLTDGPNSASIKISSKDLVPGDLIEITDGFTLPCDGILISGVAIVNESMLTGESTPVIKASLPDLDDSTTYTVDTHNKHTLFSGTTIIQTRPTKTGQKVIALVTKTGYQTAKGQLVRSILFPKPMKLRFYHDAFRFVGVLFILAGIGFIFSIIQFIRLNATPLEIVLRGLDLFTIAVPPALPLALTVGQYEASRRLQKQLIYCISPPRINEAGKIEIMCFDKTGTLTEDGLDVMGVRGLNEGIPSTFADNVVRSLPQIPHKLLQCLGTCHAISEVKGTLIGDPLDVKMFQFTSWELEEPMDHDHIAIVHPKNDTHNFYAKWKLGILKRFEFSSALQRMSVLAENSITDKIELYAKGSPEKMKSLCVPQSIPFDFDTVLSNYAKEGYRVIACAYQQFPSDINRDQLMQCTRDQLEVNLEFLGFLIMSNPLKSDTTASIETLNNARIKNIMITGDNVLTAVTVGKQCGILHADAPVFVSTVVDKQVTWVDSNDPSNTIHLSEAYKHQLAVTGEAFNLLEDEELIRNVLPNSYVYARMTPKDKTRLVEYLLSFGKIVGMCGDGANDCGALKTAHVGLSLSEAEASVAAPFTSKRPSISSVITLLREGRCALVTSFQLFKYMALYSMIQFSSVLVLYQRGCVLGDYMFLYTDMFIIVPLAYAIGLTAAYPRLTNHKPSTTLVSKPVLVSLIGQILIQILFLIGIYQLLQAQSWYTPFQRPETFTKGKETTETYETTTIFLFSNFQYISVVIAYSISYPFRKPIWSNKILSAALVIQIAASVLFTLFVEAFSGIFWTVDIPISFRFIILVTALINGGVNWIFERIFVVWLFTPKAEPVRHTQVTM